MKRYIKLLQNQMASDLKIEVYYSKGGLNYFTYETEKRGYYLSVSPVTVKNENGCHIESWTAFTGVKKLIKEVKRQNEKAYKEACYLGELEREILVQRIIENYNLKLA